MDGHQVQAFNQPGIRITVNLTNVTFVEHYVKRNQTPGVAGFFILAKCLESRKFMFQDLRFMPCTVHDTGRVSGWKWS